MNKNIIFSLSLILSSPSAIKGLAQEKPTVVSFENRQVGKITVKIENLPEGTTFDKQTILSKLRTRDGDPFSQYVFDQDLKQLANEHDQIDPQILVKNDKIDIVLRVWLRPIINKIDWEGNEFIKTRSLRKELDIKPGTLFNRTNFNKQFNKVKEQYIKKGYFESQLSYELVPTNKTREVDVIIKIKEGRSGKVDDIVFQGFNKKEESYIISKLYSKKYSNLTSWFTGTGRFVEEALEQDRLTIFNYLQDEGYADARVKIKLVDSGSKGKIIIDISADKGPLYQFGQISFEGNVLFTDQEIEKVFSARPSETYSPEKLRKTTEQIKDLYGRKGFIDTNVTYETQLARNTPCYDVHFQIDEGNEYQIGMIRIIGNTTTDDRVILRESLLVPGEKFDSIRLKVTQARLENIGYFKAVNVYAVRTQDDLALGDNYRDIYIEVEETQTGNISLFSGFSSADSVFGGLDLTEKNFNYQGLGSVLSEGFGAMRGAGEFLHARASLGRNQQNYLLSWLTPYFLDTMWRVGFELVGIANNKLISNDYSIDSYNLGAFISYPLSPYLSYGFKYRIKNYDVVVSRKIASDPENDDKLEYRSTRGILSGLGSSINWDSTDSALKPHRGLRSSLEGEVAGLGGDLNFFRTSFINSYYTPLWSHGYMHYRADFRFLYPFGKSNDFAEIPLSERFFLGGVGSVRGYKDFIIGPVFTKLKEVNGNRESVDSYDPTGGLSSSLLSIEYVQELFPFLDAFAFIDSGYITDKTFAIGTYRMSYGIGLNIDILGRMPMTLGWGFPVNAKSHQTEKNNFFFSLGGQF